MKKSAGILLYRLSPSLQLFLVHPGGPFFTKKDYGCWSIPKGEIEPDETALETALREFKEETGTSIKGNEIQLQPVKQKGGKQVYCYAIAGDIDPAKIICNSFSIEWPLGSGKMKEFPEIDKGEWFSPEESKLKINQAQIAFIDELISFLADKI